MHIALLVPPSGKQFAGIERTSLNLARGFSEKGLDVDLVLAEELPALPPLPSQIRLIILNAPRLRKMFFPLLKYLRQEKPQVMLCPQIVATCLAIFCKKLSKGSTRIISTIRGKPSIEKKQSLKDRMIFLAARYFYSGVDEVVAVSNGAAYDFAKTIRFPLEKVKVIYNPVISEELLQQAEEPLDHPWFASGEPPVILGVGRLTKQKDFPTLIRAFALVRKERLARLMILGEGEERPRLEALVQELGLEKYVALPGFVSNPYKYMKRASVFVLSSKWEGLGNVLIEAMAVGTPVVSTNCESGPAEILEGGKWGKLVPVGDAEALARAIIETLDSEPDREKLRSRAECFNISTAVKQYLTIIQEIK